jgi:cation:H+ antiporter
MILSIGILIGGLVLLIKGADWLVEGASSLARKYNISDMAIGLTIVAFGTSAPEMVVNVFAAMNNHPDLVFGNLIGSNNFNLLAILGIAGIIMPMTVQSSTVWKEIPLSLLAAIVLFVLGNDAMIWGAETNIISRFDALILLVMFGGFLFYVYKQMKTDPTEIPATAKNHKPWMLALYIAGGLTGLVIGGRLVVTNAVSIATAMGVSEKIIGLTIVAAGTSLPELATSVVAALKKNNDIAIGNIIGSNIFNIFLILGVSAMTKPAAFSTVFNTDIYILIGATLFLFIYMFTGKQKRLDRWEAALFLLFYIGYTTFMVLKEV